MANKLENIAPVFIDGKWEKIKTLESNKVYNPATEEVISLTPVCGKNEVERAVESSSKAFKIWSKFSYVKRAEILFNYTLFNSNNQNSHKYRQNQYKTT